MKIELALAPRDPAALTKYANQVSTPGSPVYHDYIARGQFASLFGPTSATIDSVYAALRARGLKPGTISSDHLSIPITATAGQIGSALGVTMASYRIAGGGTGFANTNAPRLPANIASQIQAITGLDDLVRLQPLAMTPSQASSRITRTRTPTPARERTGGPQPCRRARAKHKFNARTADQLAFAYEFSKLYHAHHLGRGQTVGIVELGQPDRNSDIRAFKRCYGIHTRISYHKVDGFHQHFAGEEATLDIETAASLVPRAKIVVYQGPNTLQDANDVYRAIVDQDRARVISTSFGICERLEGRRLANAATTLYLQGALQGQTFVASSGDTGSEDCLGNDGRPSELAVNFPASDPFVLGVGGTTLFHLGQPPNLGEAVSRLSEFPRDMRLSGRRVWRHDVREVNGVPAGR